ncbi:uracil phosphoribosyltransferase [Fusarium solani]|uniref:uracil phosphoribosyltransferase n=1 Tax=Fusarium solani TaxID=169388 RepID=A0A9P9GIX6_FUSSL|nr:uracil phosphoribosyltransferase [Fusarium solani]KAH7240394.1 uracil phosphoribosyltransferase [Fusarium solani]
MTILNGNDPSSQGNLKLLPQGNSLLSSMTAIRSSETGNAPFIDAFEKVARQLIVSALDFVPTEPFKVVTPTGRAYNGHVQRRPVCGVSILRAGASFEGSLRDTYRGPLSFGTILIQRDETTCLPTHIYSKLPRSIVSSTVLILEPMLATGGSASKAIEVLKENGVAEKDIVFVNLIASRTGLEAVMNRFPELLFVTAAIYEDMTPSRYVKLLARRVTLRFRH